MPCEFSLACGEFPRQPRIRSLFDQIVQQAEQRAIETVQVGGRDVLVVRQPRSRVDAGGGEVAVGETEHALIVPYYGLCFVGAESSYLFGGGGDAVLTRGGGGVAAAEELAVGDACGSQAHEGVVEAGHGNVGDESCEEDFEIGLECYVGIVRCVLWAVSIDVKGCC